MPSKSMRKGSNFEREVLHKAEAIGLKGHRNRVSRAQPGESWDLCIAGKYIECKKRKNPIEFIKKNLKPSCDALVFGANGGEWWAIMRGDDWLKLM
jgi:hypothetical protein